MKRNKQGVLVFDNPAEEKAYNDKKEAFLARTDEENISIFNKELMEEYDAYTRE